MYKVLIVEDEAILRRGIISLINWHALGCEVVHDASNGQDALEYLRGHTVDLVITDIKMPRMSGLELAEELNRTWPEICVIILTAYSDFELAQRAIRCNVCDYVLKSNFVKELPLIVENTLVTLSRRRRLLNIGQEKLPSEELNKFFLKGLADGSLRDMTRLSAWLDVSNMGSGYYFAVIVELDSKEIEAFEDQRPDLLSTTEEFLSLAFKDIPHIYGAVSENKLLILLCFPTDDETDHANCIMVLCNDILSTVKNYMNFNLNIGVSQQCSRHKDIPIMVEQARTALSGIYLDTSVAFYEPSTHADVLNISALLKSSCEKIFSAVQIQAFDEIDAVIDALFLTLSGAQVTPEKLRIYSLLFLSQCLLHLPGRGVSAEDSDALMQYATYHINRTSSAHSMAKISSFFFSRILEKLRQSDTSQNPLISQVNAYIAEHYMSPIQLDTIANYLHISKSYLSRLYKKETGTSIISYLNRYRIERAKELFLSGKHVVSEVGYAVGFDDPAYFTNVFSKYVGKSPRSYIMDNG